MTFPKNLVSDISKLWRSRPVEGITLENRYYRNGYLGQPPSAFVSEYHLKLVGTVTRQDKYLGTVPADVYEITYKSILPQEMLDKIPAFHFNDGFRFDCYASWQRSVLERKRQNLKLKEMWDHPILKQTRIIADATRESFRDYQQALAQFILNEGDWSEEQFAYYCKEHKTSSLGGYSWAQFYFSDGESISLTDRGREAYRYFTKTVMALCLFMLDDSRYVEDGFFDNNVIDPVYLYAALRSRPGELIDMEPQEVPQHRRIRVAKYRDRNAAGIWVVSQYAWPIFRDELKEKMYKRIYGIARKTFGHAGPTNTPEEQGKDFFLKLKDSGYTYYDTSNAEKLEGALFKLPFRSCLGHAGISGILGDTKISGATTTRTDGEWAESGLRRAIVDTGYADKDNNLLRGGDNTATKEWIAIKKLDEIGVFSPAGRMLGFTQQGESGFRLTRDGADTHYSVSNKFKGYWMRNKIIPATSLTKSLLSLGLSNTSFWDLYETMEFRIEHFEAGGPTSRDRFFREALTDRSKSLLEQAFEDLNSDFRLSVNAIRDKCKIVDDFRNPTSYNPQKGKVL